MTAADDYLARLAQTDNPILAKAVAEVRAERERRRCSPQPCPGEAQR